MTLPIVVQHSWGTLGGGGPIGALNRLMESRLTERYEFVAMHQEEGHGGVNVERLREWSRRLKEIRPDLVHVRGLGNEGFHGVVAARMAGCPRILVSVHGTQRDLSGRVTFRRKVVVNALEPLTLHLATHVTTVCEFAAQRPFVQRHRAKLVGPIVNGVTLAKVVPTARESVRAEWEVAPDDVVLVSVGRLSWEKGHGDLAAALRAVDAPLLARVVLVVVGDGPDKAAIETAYHIDGLRVHMLGRRHDIPVLLAAGDVFALPSWHENLSNALVEAMASGLPVIASRVGGNTEVVRRGGGLLVGVHDPSGLAEAISRLVADVGMRRRLGMAALGVARAHYSTEAMVESVDRVYRDVLGAGQ